MVDDKPNILLVDDRPDNLLALEAVLDDPGRHLVKAASGEEALRLLLEMDFAVVILDVRRHDPAGFETARRIRSRERSRYTPILFLTDHDDNRLSMEAAYSLGAIDHLVRPAAPGMLRAKAAGFIELFRKTGQVERQAEQLRRMGSHESERDDKTKAEEEARRFKFISDHSNDAHFLIDREARFLYVNRRTVELLAYSEDELLRMRVHDVDPSFPPERHRELFDRLHRGDRVPPFETSVVRRDGAVIPVEISVTGVPFEGRPFLFAVARDIRERKRVEHALRDSEERIRTLSDNLPHGAIYQAVLDADRRGGFTYISAGVERLLGVTPDEVRNDPNALYGLVHEEDRPRMMAREAAALRDLTPFDCEFRSRTRAGGVVWVHCRSAPRRLADGGAVWDGVILDVTDRKKAEEASRRSEERFRRLFAANIVGVGVSDADGGWLEANDELLRIIGFGREEVRSGQARWIDRTPEQYLPLDEERIAEARTRGACTPYEKEYVRKDGSLVPVLLGFAALEEGRDHFLCFVLDLTPQKRVEAALKEADRRKDEFLAMLAHELRNPLAPVRTAVQILKLLGPADPNLHQAREMIERQVGHLTRLVDDLLDVSRITRGKINLQKEAVELATVIARAVETSRPLVEERRQDLTVALPPEPVWVEGDATRLAQVLSNLLNNAAKYTEAGGRIGLTVERGRDEAVVRVKDSGQGIPPDLLPHVFDLFTQGDRSPARSEGGLGIGLTLVRSLVEMHGGGVEARSDGAGKGSEFVVRLPALRAEPPAPEGGGKERADGSPAAPRRVLVVDDNVDGAEMLAMWLRIEGHEVRIAHDGPAALRSAESFRPEVVVLDIGLPRMDGYQVARRLREQSGLKKVLLVALTGYGQEKDRRKALEAGFDAHLVKPADPAALLELLARPLLAER